MRRLLPRLPGSSLTFAIHTGQTAVQTGALLAVAVLAMAAAPPVDPARDDISLRVAPPVTAVAKPAGPVTRAIAFVEPVAGHDVNSPFGMRRLGGEPGVRMHKGVDIAAPQGTTVAATSEGRVLRIGYDPEGYGNFIELSHPNGLTSLYGHLSRIDVASGDEVAAGGRIGLVGSTGYSTGPHLHFEVRRAGGQVNPTKVIGRTFQIRAKALTPARD